MRDTVGILIWMMEMKSLVVVRGETMSLVVAVGILIWMMVRMALQSQH